MPAEKHWHTYGLHPHIDHVFCWMGDAVATEGHIGAAWHDNHVKSLQTAAQ